MHSCNLRETCRVHSASIVLGLQCKGILEDSRSAATLQAAKHMLHVRLWRAKNMAALEG